MYQQICSPILWVVFLFCWWFPFLYKNFLVWCSPICLWTMSEILLPMFSSMIFIISGLTIKSLIHFEFIPVYGVRKWSSFIFLLVSVQFSQNHLLNKLSLAHCMCLLPLPNINWLLRCEFISGLSSIWPTL